MSSRIAVVLAVFLAALGMWMLRARESTGDGQGLPRVHAGGRSSAEKQPELLVPVEERAVTRTSIDSPLQLASSSETSITISVQDDLGFPIAEAEVFESTSDGHLFLARSDSKGTATIALSPRGEQRFLTVAAPFHATAFLDVFDDVDRTYSVMLGRRASVSGHVRLSDGATPVANVRVMAITPAESYEATDHPGETTRLESVRAALTGPGGEFRIDGLREGDTYELRVLSAGYGTRIGDRLDVVASKEGLVLRVVPLVGCLVRFTCRDSAYLSEHFRSPLWRVTSPPGLVSVPGTFGRELRGPGRIHDPDRFEIDAVFGVADPSVEIPAVVQLVTNMLAFERVDAELRLFPLDGSPLRVQEIDLIPTMAESGSVRIELLGEPAEVVDMRTFKATLLLRAGTGVEPSRIAASIDPPGTACTIDRIPAGPYEWRLESGSGIFGFPEVGWGHLSVAAGRTASIEIDLASHGYIQLQSFDKAGEPAFSIVTLSDRHIVGSQARSTWRKPVPCIRGVALVGPVPPGDYNVELEGSSFLADSDHFVTVSPGVVHHEVLVLSAEDQ